MRTWNESIEAINIPFFDSKAYARCAAKQTKGKLFVDQSAILWKLPDEDKYNNGDILWRQDGVYGLFNNKWRFLVNTDGYPMSYTRPKTTETTNTAEWLALLEDSV